MEQPRGIIVKHSADRMKAYVSLSNDFGQITVGMVLTELLNKGIVHGIDNEAIRSVVGESNFNSFVEVASGTEPKPGVDGKVEMLISADGDEGGGGSDKLIFVESGDTLARHVPPVPGTEGMDVFGNAVAPPETNDVTFIAGDGVVKMSSSSNPDILVSTCDGVLRCHPSGKIDVRPYKDIHGDIDKGAGRVSFTGDMKITGNIRSGVTVVVTGSLMVGGGIDGASVRCGGDLTVGAQVRGAGGVTVVECGGSVEAVGIENAKFLVGGDVRVTGNIINSEVNARGRVKAGVIAGGKVSGVGGVTADRIGYDTNNEQTVIDVGGIHRLAGERAVLTDSMVAQRLLLEGCVSELFSFVRDNMGADGKIPGDKLPSLEWYEKNLTESVARCREFEKSLDELDELMKKMSGCNVSAKEVYPNVIIKLGFADRQVKDVMKNVLLKPSGVV
ncbi:MAG: FapA family protein [Chitinispirillales bacterium]|nr:FapA family protein [Chitinispirillales bacterium]